MIFLPRYRWIKWFLMRRRPGRFRLRLWWIALVLAVGGAIAGYFWYTGQAFEDSLDNLTDGPEPVVSSNSVAPVTNPVPTVKMLTN